MSIKPILFNTDMEYEDLIERLNQYSADYQCHGGITAEAADAIKNLLAEREAAVKELYGRCSKCKHSSSGLLDFPCTDCRFEGGTSVHWEWRGPTPPDRKQTES